MNHNEKVDYKKEILEILEDFPFGLTITELSEKSGFHRNTISKYMNIFKAEGLVNKKEIATASVYYTKQRKYLRKDLVISFIKALLSGLKEINVNQQRIFKEIGRHITKDFQFPIGDTYIEMFKKAKNSSKVIPKLKLFQLFYNSFDFFQDDIEITIIELNSKEIIYRLENSEFLDPSGKYIYFFYIACGITEGIYLQNLNMEIECEVKNISISEDNKNSYIDISIKKK